MMMWRKIHNIHERIYCVLASIQFGGKKKPDDKIYWPKRRRKHRKHRIFIRISVAVVNRKIVVYENRLLSI